MSSSSSAKSPPTRLRMKTISASSALRTDSKIDSSALWTTSGQLVRQRLRQLRGRHRSLRSGTRWGRSLGQPVQKPYPMPSAAHEPPGNAEVRRMTVRPASLGRHWDVQYYYLIASDQRYHRPLRTDCDHAHRKRPRRLPSAGSK